MKKMGRVFWGTGFVLSGLLAGACGGKKPTYTYSGPGEYVQEDGVIRYGQNVARPNFSEEVPTLTDEQRKTYCGTYIPQEQDEDVKKSVLQRLDGVWHKHDSSSDVVGEEFTFSLAKMSASRSEGFWMSTDQISIARVCLSQELSERGQFTGFRVIEFVASNNEGIAKMAIRFETPALGHSYPTLFVTQFDYDRWGSKYGLSSEAEVFRSHDSAETAVRVDVYPFKR